MNAIRVDVGRLRIARVALIVVGLALWFWTQSLIAQKQVGIVGNDIGDAILTRTAPINAWLNAHASVADGLLIASSLGIDALGIFLIAATIFGRTARPFIGLMLLFAMRQCSQMLTSLPPIDGMIWRDPGFPSLLVTYGIANDLFFSGHTALAVFGAAELSRTGNRGVRWIGVVIAAFEIATVLVLRAHYTMDVFAGAMAALFAINAAEPLAERCDCLLGCATIRRAPLPSEATELLVEGGLSQPSRPESRGVSPGLPLAARARRLRLRSQT
jgi:hypothetical protein